MKTLKILMIKKILKMILTLKNWIKNMLKRTKMKAGKLQERKSQLKNNNQNKRADILIKMEQEAEVVQPIKLIKVDNQQA